MRKPEPILVAHLFAPLHDELLALLRSLTPDEWNAPTVAGSWTVKDVAAHLLDTCLRRLSMHRDGYTPSLPFEDLPSFVNGMNASAVEYARRLSPEVVIDLHARYGVQQAEFFASLDPCETAKWGVSWAGEEESPMWFDIARELTERWHHQQQIRDAVGRLPLYETYLAPVLDTFVRALPYTYREVSGGPLVLNIEGEGVWSLVDGTLYSGAAADPVTTVTLEGDKAWRLFTRQKIDPGARVEGDARLAEPLLKMTAVV
ncbi:MAG TPA: maleylpyruvate isomerase N-terminal domain-containing protein [Thermoanaerobaculia bacterium]|nr:maleylpyruvate isomerase N-terminal domain-containing protein [Thermoanaerobaculia bacterium]